MAGAFGNANGFKQAAPLQDLACDLGMDTILACDDTIKLNQMLMDLNAELDDLRDKRLKLTNRLYRMTCRESDIDGLQDAIHSRMHDLELSKKSAVNQINRITEKTKTFILEHCTVNIE